MIKRILTVGLIVVLGVSLDALAQSYPSGPKGRDDGRSLTRRNLGRVRSSVTRGSAKSLLRKRVEDVDWDESTLDEVVDWLTEQAEEETNILFRWNALQAEGVDEDFLVTLQIRGTTIAKVLSEVVDQMSPAGEVTFHGTDNFLIVSTKADFGRKLPLRVYEVTDVLFHVPDFGRSAPTVDLQKAARSGGGGGGGTSIFSGSQSSSEDLEVEEQEVEERLEDLRALIQNVVEPDSWLLDDGSGAGLGRIQLYDNRFLIVRNTVEVHEALAGYFAGVE